MDWVKLHCRYYADPKVEGLDDAAEVMFVRSLALAGDREQRGFIPETSLPLLARRRRYERLVSALVAGGLWTPVDGGYVITAWSDWQDAADALAERRTADRERQRRRRRRQKESMSRDIEDSSRDVTETELETDPFETKGGEPLQAAAPAAPPPKPPNNAAPPRKCPAHLHDPAFTGPCGQCADARYEHERWLREHPVTALDGTVAAQRKRAEFEHAELRCTNATDPDPNRVARVSDLRAALRPNAQRRETP